MVVAVYMLASPAEDAVAGRDAARAVEHEGDELYKWSKGSGSGQMTMFPGCGSQCTHPHSKICVASSVTIVSITAFVPPLSGLSTPLGSGGCCCSNGWEWS